MKSTVLTLSTLVLGLALHAQITVSSTNIATLGDTVLMSEDTAHGYGLDLESAAGDQHWDFSALVEHNPDGAILQDPQTAPLFANFPNATFVVNDIYDDSVHIFFRQTSAELEVLGMVGYDTGGNPVIPDFNPPFPFMQFPATMGTTFSSDEYVAAEQVDVLGFDPDSLGPHPYVDSLKTVVSMSIHNEIDAWGDLELPQGTYVTIRQKVIVPVEFHTTCYYNGSWQPLTALMLTFIDSVTYDTNTENTYRWWSNNGAANFMCAEVREDNGNVDSTVSFIKAIPDPPSGVVSNSLKNFSCYPMPASDFIQVQSDEPVTVRLHDVRMTQVLHAPRIQGDEQLDVSALPPGTYLMQVLDEHGALFRMDKIQIAR